ncbi:MAG: ABC transporter ATP-binding protein, partial [Chloroflexi bacterium]|nr:ABC transporter ATP-binding protein [Chloroflexota bacterium]
MLAVIAGVARLAVAAVVIFEIIHEDAAFSSLAWPLAGMIGLILVRSGLQYLQEVISHHTASVVKVALRERLYNHCLALGPGYFDQSRTGDVLMSLAEGVERLEAFFGRYLPQMIVAALAPILIFVFMAIIDFRTGLVFLAFALLTLVLPNLFHRWTRNSSMARRDAYGALGADFLDAVQGLPTLKAFGQSKARGVLLADRARTLFRTTMGVLAANSATSALTILGIAAGAAVALAWGAVRVSNDELELRALLIVLMLGVEIFRPLRELTQLYHDGMIAMSSAEGIFDIMDAQVEVADAAEITGPLDLSPEITFEGVDYAYSGGRRPALHDLSFTLKAGETLGLVGASGAGKSTIVWSMLRFFDPQKGRILLGGTDIREIPLKQLREQMAVVTQDTYLFHGTVAENLRFGGPGATQEQLEAAARAANAHDFISHLPQGYDTIVGERAVRLSGGQKQRIAIARALLKDAPILVLDEALSSVDAENEARIQEALDHLMEGRTTLIIAHRLSSVVKADRIIVLEDGRLVESGNHSELVAAGGVYAELMAQQQELEDDDVVLPEAAHAPEAPAHSAVQDAEAFVPKPAHQGEGHHHHAVPSGGAAHAPASVLGIFTVWRRL